MVYSGRTLFSECQGDFRYFPVRSAQHSGTPLPELMAWFDGEEMAQEAC